MTRAEFTARALGAMLESAATDPGRRLCIDHADLPEAIWQRVAPHFGLEVDTGAIECMTEQSQFYSKDPAPQPFSEAESEDRPVTDVMREAAQRFAEPGYFALSSRTD
jgi:hypothetical protein